VEFAQGEMSKTVLVAITDDALVEGNETVIGTISGASTGVIGTASATGIIVDNDLVSVISLAGTALQIGNLINPYIVEGRTYYVWDRNGDGAHDNIIANGLSDWISMNELEMIFFGNSVGAVMTNDNRTMTLSNGVTIMLPTRGDDMTATGMSKNGTAVNSPTQNNSTYDDLLAIWDAHNGNGTGTNLSGLPSGWGFSHYWSATPSASGHAAVALYSGYVSGYGDDLSNSYVAFQVL